MDKAPQFARQAFIGLQIRCRQQLVQALETPGRQAAQQIILVPEMMIERGARHPGPLGQPAQRQCLQPLFAQHGPCLAQQSGMQIPVMVVTL